MESGLIIFWVSAIVGLWLLVEYFLSEACKRVLSFDSVIGGLLALSAVYLMAKAVAAIFIAMEFKEYCRPYIFMFSLCIFLGIFAGKAVTKFEERKKASG